MPGESNAVGGIAADRNLKRSVLLGFAGIIAAAALFGLEGPAPLAAS